MKRNELTIDLNERCIAHPAATFFVEADTGTSMTDFGIFPGDTLVVDRSLTAKQGDVVMVLWEGGYMVKQWWFHRGALQLCRREQVAVLDADAPEPPALGRRLPLERAQDLLDRRVAHRMK